MMIDIIGVFYSINYSRDSSIQKLRNRDTEKLKKNKFFCITVSHWTDLSRNDLSDENTPNIKLPTIGWFFPTHLLPTH